MASYTLWQRCRPRGDFRIAEIIDFLNFNERGISNFRAVRQKE